MSKNEYIENSLTSFQLPPYKEIPSVGLYLDQVTKYINSYLSDFPEMQVTPSMISNYVKLKIVSKANKKTYNQDQIAYFIFIAMAKTVLSMDHIRTTFAIQVNCCEVSKGYEYFRTELESVMAKFYEASSIPTVESPKTTEEIQMLHNICVTIAHKMYLDRYFEFTTVPTTDD